MPLKLYELRVVRVDRGAADEQRFHAALDLSDPLVASETLHRHLFGAVARAGAPRREAHLFTVEVRQVDRDGAAYGEPVLRWALPVDPEEVR